ncbi:meiosis-specific nuclear structural protein 1-like [Diorhabda sublineata]|uniref:meiosis-specific nuclear structural protein 1-like n=1 Tax=Diorhabda sublineata TaxID=1163346 RepID=UPI0024E181F0|nr:meiosis-specific nuclear structural protein 1-like [Diorhabda sublineata]
MSEDIRRCFIDNTPSKNEIIQEQTVPDVQKKDDSNVDFFKIKPHKMIPPEKRLNSELNLKDFQSSLLQHVEEKNAHRNFERYVNMYRREYEEEEQAKKTEYAFKEKQLYQENELAKEMDVIKRKEFREAKMRQLLRQNSSELRELERKLKAAYINKELAAQIAQNQAEKVNEKIRESQAHEVLKQAWIDQEEYQKQCKQEEMIKKAQYKQELQEQLILREKIKRHLYEEYLREKKLIDDIVQRIQDEDEREAYERFCKMKKTRAEMVAFKNAQETWKKKRMEEIEEENRKIEEYLMTKTAGVQARQLELARKEAEREKIIDDIARKMCEQKEKQREREEIIQDLQEEEQRAIIDKRHREDVEKQLRIKLETRECLTQQMQDRQERARQEAEEDRKYKEELLTKLAEDAKLEQVSDQKRRLKMLQFKRDIEQMMKERRQKYAEEFQLLIEIEKDEQRKEEARRRIIEEERIKMLQQHVKNLIGYLPKGLLKAEDLPHLGADFVSSALKDDPSTSNAINVCDKS